MQLRSLYGGRHLRTTLVLALASGAAGAATGGVLTGVGVAGAPAAHTTQPVTAHHHKAAPRVRHTPAVHTNLVVRHSASPSPTRSSPRPTPTKTQPTTPPATTATTATTTSPQPTDSTSPTATSAGSPGPTGSAQPATI